MLTGYMNPEYWHELNDHKEMYEDEKILLLSFVY